MTMNDWFFPRHRLAQEDWETVVGPDLDGWQHTGLRVASLDGGTVELPADEVERMVVPLSGAFRVATPLRVFELTGRAGVFDGPTDVVYLGAGSAATISGSGRVAVAEAPTDQVLPDAHLPAAEVPLEIRGAGRSTRQVHNFGTPDGLDAAKLIVCEVITPAENWSSYPPHKHDEAGPTESRLEEIYYFEAAPTRGSTAPEGGDPFGFFATYSSPAGAIDTAAMVRTGDVALVPYGYHGPAAAAPGYDLYYLNVMAGPGPDRAWRISDDPAHAWIRSTWDGRFPDPRLPYAP
ncbi:MAG: iolB [Amnibacterium sp.]|nr:iolB [Amnibacterium sp.]